MKSAPLQLLKSFSSASESSVDHFTISLVLLIKFLIFFPPHTHSKLRIQGPCLTIGEDGVWREAIVLQQEIDDTLTLHMVETREQVGVREL